MSDVPTRMPTPMLDINRSCDCERVMDSGSAPARKELSRSCQLAPGSEGRRGLSVRQGHDHLLRALLASFHAIKEGGGCWAWIGAGAHRRTLRPRRINKLPILNGRGLVGTAQRNQGRLWSPIRGEGYWMGLWWKQLGPANLLCGATLCSVDGETRGCCQFRRRMEIWDVALRPGPDSAPLNMDRRDVHFYLSSTARRPCNHLSNWATFFMIVSVKKLWSESAL